MTRRRLFYLACLIGWVGVLAFVAKRSLDRLPPPTWGTPAGSRASSLELASGAQVGQSFVAPLPGLYRIDVTLAEAAAGPGPVSFHLKSSPDADADLWTATLAGDELQAGRTLSFSFPVLPDSSEQSYYFYLESPAGASDAAAALDYVPGSVLDGARAYVNGQAVAGNLQFQTFYGLRTRDRLHLILSRMAAGRPYMFGSEAFYAGLGLAYVLAVGALIRRVAGAIWGEQEGGP